MSKSMGIRRIVRIRQMLKQWREKARIRAYFREAAPSDVPAGHVAVCVGSGCKRFIVRATYLNHPIMRRLLVQAEEEYGLSREGPLTIPCCDETTFEEILRILSRPDSSQSGGLWSPKDFQRCYLHVGARNESMPLLRGLADKSVC